MTEILIPRFSKAVPMETEIYKDQLPRQTGLQLLADCPSSRKCPYPGIYGQHKLNSIGYLKEKGRHEVWGGYRGRGESERS